MKKELEELMKHAKKALEESDSFDSLEEVRVEILGRKGKLTSLLKGLKDMKPAKRKEAGKMLNKAKTKIEKMIEEKESELEEKQMKDIGKSEWIDVTEPGCATPQGSLHLVTKTINDITNIFHSLGFSRVSAPEVDWDYYAFESLNMPCDHPARDDWETFFMDAPVSRKRGRQVLTPHTSNMQVRIMEENKPPLRVINIARVYRRQSDPSHVPMFHQVEGLAVDENITLSDLKGTIEHFLNTFFGEERKIRFRPYHFRFTEPSFEIDIDCDGCKASSQCRLCKSGWLELAGAGMTHPNVLKAGGVNPKKYSAFAFGFGVERIAMMRGGLQIPDMRMLYQNDLRFLNQF